MAKRHKYDYFAAYEELSDLAVHEANVLIDCMDDYTCSAELTETLEKVHELEHAGDQINHDIFKNAAVDFMPPFDREDIVSLAQALDTVLDDIEAVIQYFYMYNINSIPDDAKRFAKLIKKSCKAVDKAMEDFRNFKKSKTFKQLIMDVNVYEEEGDELYMEVIRSLHTDETADPMDVVTWSRMYSYMERCCDACEHAADLMSTILVKNM